jgi:hypothetical protein
MENKEAHIDINQIRLLIMKRKDEIKAKESKCLLNNLKILIISSEYSCNTCQR